MSEEQVKEQEKKEELEPAQAALKEQDDAPSQEQVELWKAQHGDVFVMALSPSEVFVFRCLQRREHLALQNHAAQNNLTEIDWPELVVNACLLWSRGDVQNDWSVTKAGTVNTLYEQIMANSNFLNPMHAASLVSKL